MLFNGVSPSIIEMSLSTGIESTMAFNVTRLHGSFFLVFRHQLQGFIARFAGHKPNGA